MNPEQWQKVKEIFDAALKREPNELSSFLDKACDGNQELRREVEILLASSENVGSFMEQAAIGEVAEIFVGAEKNLQTGERFNHYEIIRRLGAGGMGEVYAAEDTKLHRRVALKLLPQSLSSDRDANRRLLREARAAAALDHPHICQIHEIAETGGRSFIVMQFCEGETLAEKIERENLTLRETLDLAVQIADALANAHSHQVIHRDIKPANIIVNNRGQAKILDFGLAKIFGENPNAGSEDETVQLLSQANMIVGTPPYMSPEQARGEPLDARTDIFSFGALLYEMLSGKQVFSCESHAETISAILSFEPPIAKTLADTPTELQRIVRKSLAKDKEERYQTAKDLLIDLQNIKQESDFQDKLERTAEPRSEARTQILDAAETTGKEKQSPNAEIIVSRSKNRRLAYTIGLIVLIFAIGGFGYWFFVSRNAKPIDSIAVMPFVNESGNADNEYLSDGMTESLISSLSQLPNLNVKARSSVFRYKGKEADLPKIAAELNVQVILTGRVGQRGEQLLLSLELVDASTENVIWSERYTRQQVDLVSLQTEIARDVSQKLKTKLTGADEQQWAKNYTANAEAYQLYLKGRFHWNKRTVSDFRKSIEYFQQAIAADPNYALAYAGLADTYVLLSEYNGAPPREVIPKARQAALKALSLDDKLVEAHTALGLVLCDDYDFAGAEREYKRALELNPNDARTHLLYGWLLTYFARHEEGLAEVRRALEIEPLSLIINRSYGDLLLYARKYDESIAQLKKTLDMDANFESAHNSLGYAYWMNTNYAESVEEFAKRREVGGNQQLAALMRESFAKSGWEGFLRMRMGEFRTSNTSSYGVAIYAAALGEKDEAFAELNKAFENREFGIVLLKVDPRLDPLRDDPRFQDLLRRVGLPP